MGPKTLIYLAIAAAVIWFTTHYFKNRGVWSGDGNKAPGKIEKYLKKPVELRDKINKATEESKKNKQKILDELD
jgi:hypothetical protein